MSMLRPRISAWPIDSGCLIASPGLVFDAWLDSRDLSDIAARIEVHLDRPSDQGQSSASPQPALIARFALCAGYERVGECDVLLITNNHATESRLPVWAGQRSMRPSAWESLYQLLVNDATVLHRAPHIPAREGELRAQVTISGTPDSPPRLLLILLVDFDESRELASRLRRTCMEFKRAEASSDPDPDDHTHIALSLAINGLDVGESELTLHVAPPSDRSVADASQPTDGRGWRILAEQLVSELRCISGECCDDLHNELRIAPFWASSAGPLASSDTPEDE